MSFERATLSISEAFHVAGINPDFLPPVIRIGEIALVLSEKEDCYFKATVDGCSCDQFLSGIYPCPHQLRVWGIQAKRMCVKREELGSKEDFLERWKNEEHLIRARWKKEREERLELIQIEHEERLKRENEERLIREHLKREDEERLKSIQIEQEKRLKRELQEHLAEIKRYAKPDQTGSPKEKHALYNNTKKKLDKSVIDSVESDQIIAHFRDD